MIKRWSVSFFLFFALNAVQEKPMVVVIPSYNNVQWYQQNLASVFCQEYSNYRVIYIDDCSPDGTGDVVAAYLNEHDVHQRVTFIRNEVNRGAMYNHWQAVCLCDDDEIVVHLDGDDWFKDPKVLARVNQAYQDPEVWMTYGQFEQYPTGQKGFCRPMPPLVIARNAFRRYKWISSHLRSFYAGLFKQIKIEDFIFNGEFFKATCDMAFMFPLLELTCNHCQFIPDVLYIYNEATPLNDYKTKLRYQFHCDRLIRSWPRYQRASTYYCSGSRSQEVLSTARRLLKDKGLWNEMARVYQKSQVNKGIS